MNLINKIRSIVRTAVLKAIFSNGYHQTCDVSYLGAKQKAVVYSPFGLYSYPENNCFVALLQVQGREDSLIAMPFDPSQRPDMSKGDTGLATGKISLMLHKNGTIEINGASDDMVKLINEAVQLLSTTTVATALGTSPLSTQADFVALLAKLKVFEVT